MAERTLSCQSPAGLLLHTNCFLRCGGSCRTKGKKRSAGISMRVSQPAAKMDVAFTGLQSISSIWSTRTACMSANGYYIFAGLLQTRQTTWPDDSRSQRHSTHRRLPPSSMTSPSLPEQPSEHARDAPAPSSRYRSRSGNRKSMCL